MPVTVVIGGQYGSEGKGKLVSYLAATSSRKSNVVRCGGPNAGHTAMGPLGTYQLRQVPSGVVAPHCRLYMAAGMVIDLPVLMHEIDLCGLTPKRLLIDRNAVVLDDSDRTTETTVALRDRIGSTLSGTGAATARKVLRDPTLRLARQVSELGPFVGNVADELAGRIDADETVIVEGTQGFGLSLHHSDVYPYATSRDTTAAAFLSEAGLSPMSVTEIFMVLRTFPIRVAGNSGPMFSEIDWSTLTRESGYPVEISEYTTVTKKLRRVGRFDWDLAEAAARVNRPTGLAVHGVDYLNYDDRGAAEWGRLSTESKTFLSELERRLDTPVAFIFTGPRGNETIDLRERNSFLKTAATL